MNTIVSTAVRWLGLAATGIGLHTSPAGATAAEERRNVALVQQGFDAWRDGTGSPYDLLAEEVVWTITGNSLGSGVYAGKEAFMSKVIRPFNARMADRLIPTVRHLYAEGDMVIARFDAKGMARDGIAYANSYSWFLQLRDGRIVRAEAFFDSNAFDDFWSRVSPVAAR